ncbi:2642_t:CDS:2, partial [Funneliformis mosseae]
MLVDKRTLNEVNLTREFNDEKIRILFKVTPVEFLGDESEFLDAEAEEEEEEVDEISEQSEETTATSATYEGGKNEELIDSSDEDFEEEPDPEKTLRCAITIEKKEKGVLAFEAFAREGSFLIDNISFYEVPQINHVKIATPFLNLSR